MTTPTNETLVVLRAQSGDRAALEELLKIVQAPLYRYIYRLVNEGSVAEDVLQEVFIRIYRKLRWLERPELFRSWAYRIASRETFKRMKRERRWSEQIRDEAVLEAIPSDEETKEYEAELIEKLPSFIASVSPASRAVLVLHYLHEMTLAEVSEVLGIAIGTAKSRLAYGLRTLRAAVDRERNSKLNP